MYLMLWLAPPPLFYRPNRDGKQPHSFIHFNYPRSPGGEFDWLSPTQSREALESIWVINFLNRAHHNGLGEHADAVNASPDKRNPLSLFRAR